MRVLYVPNEAGAWRQRGLRRGLEDLKAANLIDDAEVFSLLHRVRGGERPAVAVGDLAGRIASFAPDIVLMQHLGGAGVTASAVRALRSIRDFKLVYHEGDPYSWPLHPLPREARAVGRSADVVFVVGANNFTRNFERIGSRDVRYLQWGFDPDRFPDAGPPVATGRDLDVTVIANRNTPRLRGLPGWRDRIAFVELVQAEFGDRCAIYGRGWGGPGAAGPVPFDEQQGRIRGAWVSANWDHFAGESKYHSDRLPISLAAGSVHATTNHPGFDDLFPAHVRRSMLLGDSPRSLLAAIVGHLRDTTPADRLEMMANAQDYAWANLRYDDQLVEMLNSVGAGIDADEASAAWSITRASNHGG